MTRTNFFTHIVHEQVSTDVLQKMMHSHLFRLGRALNNERDERIEKSG